MIKSIIDAYVWVTEADSGFIPAIGIVMSRDYKQILTFLIMVAVYLFIEHSPKVKSIKGTK